MKALKENQGLPESLLILDRDGRHREPTAEEQAAHDKKQAAAKAQWEAERPQREAAEREYRKRQEALRKRVDEILSEHGITIQLSEAYECVVDIGYEGEHLGTLYGKELDGADLGQPIQWKE